jgi:hypothetical protein
MIQRKLASYKRQDERHEIYSTPHFVTAEQVQAMLGEAQNKCFYCKDLMLLEGYRPRDGKQWTLDRIDNRMGHNKTNVVVCCLRCNLQRRNQPHLGFQFTKQLQVVKLSAASAEQDRPAQTPPSHPNKRIFHIHTPAR